MSDSLRETFDEMKMSLGSEGKHYSVSVHQKDGGHEGRCSLDNATFHPGVLSLSKDGVTALIAADSIAKILIMDTRTRPNKQENSNG